MIKNIIFDLCGPIITIDIDLINRQFHHMGVMAEKPYELLVEAGVTERFETDGMTPELFCNEVRRLLACSLTNEEIACCWNTLITNFAPSHVDLLKRLKGQYKTFLLSNSDKINGDFFEDYLNSHAGFDFLGTCFDDHFFSYQIGRRKPSRETFLTILEKHHLLPEETLFIDDRMGHCQGAEALGIRTHFLREGTDICDLFDTSLNYIRK